MYWISATTSYYFIIIIKMVLFYLFIQYLLFSNKRFKLFVSCNHYPTTHVILSLSNSEIMLVSADSVSVETISLKSILSLSNCESKVDTICLPSGDSLLESVQSILRQHKKVSKRRSQHTYTGRVRFGAADSAPPKCPSPHIHDWVSN